MVGEVVAGFGSAVSLEAQAVGHDELKQNK